MTTSQPLLARSSKPWTPDKDQLKAVKWLLEHAAAGLLADPGVGKTSISLAAIKILKKKKLVSKTLIIAPKRVMQRTWPEEIEGWTDFKDLKMVTVYGPHRGQRLHDDADIFLTSFDMIPWLLDVEKTVMPSGKKHISVNRSAFKKLGFDLLVVDELSKFKNHGSDRFKMMRQVASSFGRRWGLTGSPAPRELGNLFGECLILDDGRSLGEYITHFRRAYYDQGYQRWQLTLKDGAEEQIYKKIRPLMLRLEAQGLPDPVANDIWLDMPDDARKIYTDMEKEFFTSLESGDIDAANAGVALMKCRQLASGAIYTAKLADATGKRPLTVVHEAKLDALEELVDELQGSPLLLAYEFQHDLDRLKQRFGKKMVHVGGGVSAKEETRLMDAWNAGDLPILAGHPASIGHGLNLQKGPGHHVAWFTPTWDYELYDQFNRRVWRRGQAAPRVFVHHLLMRDTADAAVRISLETKGAGQQALFDAMKRIRSK